MPNTPPPDTTVPPPEDLIAQAQRIAEIIRGRQQAYAPPAPVDRSIVSLLGEAVGGGTTGLSPAEREDAGRRALLNFGANLSAASGYSTMPRTFGQVFAQGVGGAQQSLAGSEAVGAARLGAQQAYEEKQQELRLAALKEAIPLLTLQMNQRAVGAMKPPGTSISGAGVPSGPRASIGAAGGADEFAQKFTPIAQTIADQTGLPVEYVVAQAAHETGFGKSPAAANNNFFGITDPKTGKLATYATPQEGAAAYVQLMQSDRYANVPRTGTPAEIGDRMALAGYNPNVLAKDKTDSYGARIGGVAAALQKPADGGQPAAPFKVATTGTTVPAPAAAPGSVAAETAGLVVPPGATPPAPATPPSPDPNTFHYVPSPIPDTFKSLVTGSLSPQQVQNVEAAKSAALENFRSAQARGDPAAATAANDAYSKVLAEETTLLGGQTDKARDFLKEFYKNDFDQQKGIFETNQKALLDRVTQAQKAEAEGRQQRETNAAQVENTASGKLQEQINTESLAAKDRINDLDGLQVLSDQVKDKTTNLATISIAGQSLLNRLVAAGIGTKEKLAEMGNVQAFQTGVAGLIKSLRQGMSMGSLSDSDLRFVSNMAPTVMESQATRNEIIAYLKEMQQRKLQFGSDVSQLIAGGGPNGTSMKIGQAIQVAQSRMREFAPTLPVEVAAMPRDQQAQWASTHDIRPQQLVRLPDGRLAIFDVEGVTKRAR